MCMIKILEKLIFVIVLVSLFIKPLYGAEDVVDIKTDKTIVLENGEKLTAIASTLPNAPTGVILIKLQLFGQAPDGSMVVGGRSVYATGKVKLADGKWLPITNSTYQYIPQLNYKLKQLVNYEGHFVNEFLANPSSYRAYYFSKDTLKFEMRNPDEFFSVGSFGAYIKPDDIMYGVKGDTLKGIGATESQQAKVISSDESGYKARVNSYGEVVSKTDERK